MIKQLMYRLKILLKDKSLIFWTLLFPMILSVLFNVALRDAYTAQKVETMSLAVVVDDPTLNEFITALDSDYDLIESHRYVVFSEAEDALNEGLVEGIVSVDDGAIKLVFNQDTDPTSTTVVHNIFESYTKHMSVIETQLAHDPTVVDEAFVAAITTAETYVSSNVDTRKGDVFAIHFYTTIAMLIIYASEWGNKSAQYLQADMSPIGIRNGISPTPKGRLIFMDVITIYAIFVLEFAIHMLFLKFALDVPFGDHLGLMILTGLAGGLVTTMLGYTICVFIKGDEGRRVTIISGVGVFMSFLSGMMSVEIKYLIDTTMPILRVINPAAIITDNFYWIYADVHLDNVVRNIGILCLMAVILGAISYRKLKEVSYDSL